ncbi:MAG: aldehyde dehydrogenase family protein [Synergistaceae bacterium]|jgi:succinate-semialdehyde dehydrogenase/glutarate-semialdehyde dehydrogenase|nr:aldehyde dehydrogenase family protein [Synergistaceae bacterium]
MSATLKVFNPANGSLVGELPLSGKEEIYSMVDKAVKAKEAWGNLPIYKRAKILYKFCDLLEKNVEDIATTLTGEMCKPIKQSRGETAGSVTITRAFVERACHLCGEVIRTDNQNEVFENDLIFTRREPLGVMACIIPFNYPIELFVHKVAPALIMGNVCIVKAPSLNPLAMMKLGGLLKEAGLPENVCQCFVCTKSDCSEYLLAHPDVQAISLTGSTRAGVEMAKIGANTLKHMFLELGGNDPTLILEDADIDFAVETIVSNRLINAGQTCCSNKRLIVHESVAEEFTGKLVERLKKVKMGDATDESMDMSCLISEEAAVKVVEQIESTVSAGAKCLLGGTRKGAFVPPTVLTGVKKDMALAIDMEIFGPVFPIITFKTEEEGIAIANATQFGLSSGVITRDTVKALRIATKLKAGAVILNDCSNYRQMDQPFGGYKMTGLGREGVTCTMEEFSQVKSYVLKRPFNG